MTRVVVFGTFDLLHPGHVDFLSQARERGEHVTAVVARDETVLTLKGRLPVHTEQERLARLLASGLVDEAVLGDRELSTYRVLERIHPDIVCLGYDQHALHRDLSAWAERTGTPLRLEVLRPFRPDLYKTSKLIGDRRLSEGTGYPPKP